MKQVLKSPDNSTMVNDVIKNQFTEECRKTITTLHHIEIQKIMLHRKAARNAMKF